MEFKEYKIREFINDLSGDKSSPGGGSAAGLVAGLAASLNSMVYSFTVDKKSFKELTDEVKTEMLKMQSKAKEFTERSLMLMEQDRKDFMGLMDCFKLPNSTEEEKLARKQMIKENTVKAMSTPLSLAKEALSFYDNIKFAIKYGNKNLTSDGIVAAILLHGAIESAVVNVLVNYKSLKKYEEFSHVQRECEKIIEKSLAEKNEICQGFYENI